MLSDGQEGTSEAPTTETGIHTPPKAYTPKFQAQKAVAVQHENHYHIQWGNIRWTAPIDTLTEAQLLTELFNKNTKDVTWQ